LAAAAIPRFQNLKQHAEANNVIKVVMDAASAVPATVVNLVDLEGKKPKNGDVNLTQNVLTLKSGNWKVGNTNNTYQYTNLNSSGDSVIIAEMNLSATDREFNVSINCNNFSDSKTKQFCTEELNQSNYFQRIQF